MKRWKRIFRNVAVVFLSTGTILSVPVIACAHVEYRHIGKLDMIESSLQNNNVNFLRIHQSYLINPYYCLLYTSRCV